MLMIYLRKLQMKPKIYEPGYVTVFFSLTMALCLSFLFGLVLGIRTNGIRMKAECSVDTAVAGIWADYNRELWLRYGLLFTDISYCSENASMVAAETRLMESLNDNLNEQMPGIVGGKDLYKLSCTGVNTLGVRLATDNGGAPIYEQIAEYMKDTLGVGYIEELKAWAKTVESVNLDDEAFREEVAQSEKELEETYEIMDFDGWIPYVEEDEEESTSDHVSFTSVLRKVLPNIDNVSKATIDKSVYAGQRKLNEGTIKSDFEASFVDKLLFREYLSRKLNSYTVKNNESTLAYEAEYMICGTDSDIRNLEKTVKRLMLLREASNVWCLKSDNKRMTEIKIFAFATTALLGIPAAKPFAEAVLVGGWAYFESKSDVKHLLAGGKIELVKTPENWRTGLISALTGVNNDVGDDEDGMDYNCYLKLFMLPMSDDTLMKRFMTVVEQNIRSTEENKAFRLDNCIDTWNQEITLHSDFGIDYRLQRNTTVSGR